ncbi:hypothetical protein EJ06DRAFT_147425 [Trichodelitschia bisporula]|uniref:Uncharacterized protein n=1 Tax=Trichodelitschia bisporula TaxID=703511 RepID=A0A6G1HNA8_9PEZI|nr:hypothetical protein EJ06DRAFT_147425 [Trichodelitschia bisporula]
MKYQHQQPQLSAAEFTQLPDCIQRKCFSSLERLQITQTAVEELYSTTPRTPRNPRTRPPSLLLPSRSTTLKRRRRDSPPARNANSFEETLAAAAEARWYCSLPDKVRRSHFSPAEQFVLTSRLHNGYASTVASSSATSEPEPEPKHRRLERAASYATTESLSATFYSDDDEDGPSPSTSSFPAMNCFDDAPPRAHRSRASSLRRTLSISRSAPNPFRRSTSSSNPVAPAITGPISPLFTSHRHSRSFAGIAPRPSTESSSRAFDAAALYYQDPQARQKLRAYLASPAKFDEAVEFGFPSQQTSDPAADVAHVPRPPASTSNNDAQTFLKDDTISFLDRWDAASTDSRSDDGSIFGESPVTPADAPSSFGAGVASIFSALDADDTPALDLIDLKAAPDAHAAQPAGMLDPLALSGREMTLRMTLTRPELRAAEDEVYTWQTRRSTSAGAPPLTWGEDDPLALEELATSEDVTGLQGAFAVRGGGARRSGIFLRKIFGLRR